MIKWLDPKVDRYIQSKTGEQKVVEVKKHWMASIWHGLLMLLAVVIAALSLAVDSWVWYPMIGISLFLGGFGLYKVVADFRDRFVITNQRIFRVSGVISTKRGMIPLARITDITVLEPFWGKLFNYGHFVFESAGLVQGLSKVKYVRDILTREDALRIVMAGDLPDQFVSPEEDDGT